MKHDEAAKIVAVLFASYPNGKFDRDNARAFVDGIADLDAAACGAAVQRLVRTSKFLPSIAEIREAATAQRRGPRRTGEEAYAELTEAVRRYGTDYGQGVPTFADPLIARCIGIWGSWNTLCLSPADDPGGRARFIELYDELATRERHDASSGIPLPTPAAGGPAFWLERGGKAAMQLVQRTKGAGASVTADNRAAKSTAATPTFARAVPIAPSHQKRRPTPFQRRVTTDELDTALAGTAEVARA